MKHPIFARELKVGDMINGHCDGWLIIGEIRKNNITRSQNIDVLFTNGTHKTYSDDDRVDAIRR